MNNQTTDKNPIILFDGICNFCNSSVNFIIKKDNKWLVLEVNAVPALDFFETEREKLAGKILDFLVQQLKNN